MNTTIYTSGHTAFADARQSHLQGANAGRSASGAASLREVRAYERFDTLIAAMVRTHQGERLGCVRNVSPRGLMFTMPKPPQRGEIVEIFTKNQSVIGQVKWANDCQAGIALADSIDVGALIRGECPQLAASQIAAGRPAIRKAAMRPSAAAISQRSHVVARQIQFAAILILGLCAALFAALCVHDLLTGVFSQITMGLPA